MPRAMRARARDPVVLGLLAACAALLAWLLWVACTLNVDYFDAFESLLTASGLSGHPIGYADAARTYTVRRAFLYPLALSPFFKLANLVSSDPASFAFTASHLLAVIVTGLFGWSVYRLERVSLPAAAPRAAALAAAALLLFNPLVTHLAPSAKEDLAGSMATAFVLFFALRYRRSGRRKHLGAAAGAILVADSLRYNLLPIFPATLGCWLALERLLDHFSGRPRGRPALGAALRPFLREALWLGLLPLAAWGAAAVADAAFATHVSLAEAGATFFRSFYYLIEWFTAAKRPAPFGWENFGYLWNFATPPVVAAAAFGMARALFFRRGRRPEPAALLHLVFFWVFLLAHAAFITQREARYLLPALPSLAFFAVTGALELASLLGRRGVPEAVVLAALAAWPLRAGLAEATKFLDPYYRTPFMRTVARAAGERARSGRIYWLGPFYALHPRDYVLDRDDPFTYITHFAINSTVYFSGKPGVISNTWLEVVVKDQVTGALYPDPRRLLPVEDGDALIVNTEPYGYLTHNAPPTLKPLVVERARRLLLKPRSVSGGSVRLAAPEAPGTTAEVRLTKDRILARLFSPPGLHAVFLHFSDGGVAAAAIVAGGAQPGAFELPDARPAPRAALTGLELLTFEQAASFSL